ncbi:hypothetical protein ZWY2020_034414 [Hordeum vulgare]|nr:hypothetical protein ZWY2020_034414 [Hordeum vulgare]
MGLGQNGLHADAPMPEKPAAAAGRSVETSRSLHDTGRDHVGPHRVAAHNRSNGHARPLPFPHRPTSSKRRSRRARPTCARRRQLTRALDPAGSRRGRPHATSRDGSTTAAPPCSRPRTPPHQPTAVLLRPAAA